MRPASRFGTCTLWSDKSAVPAFCASGKHAFTPEFFGNLIEHAHKANADFLDFVCFDRKVAVGAKWPVQCHPTNHTLSR
jgi:hypothetical protein